MFSYDNHVSDHHLLLLKFSNASLLYFICLFIVLLNCCCFSTQQQKLLLNQQQNIKIINLTNDQSIVFNYELHGCAGDCDSYQYATYPDPFAALPKYISQLPFDEYFSLSTHVELGYGMLKRRIQYSWKLLKQVLLPSLFSEPQSYSAYEEYGTDVVVSQQLQYTMKEWMSDDFFVNQFIAGCNPVMITLLCNNNDFHLKYEFTSKQIRQINQYLALHHNHTIESLILNKHLFIIDYPLLKNIKRTDNRYIYPATVLLYVSNQKLHPLVIRLEREAESDLYFPSNTNIWMLAKLHTMCSDAMYHQLITHLLHSHLVLEPIIIAFRRSFVSTHPLFQLLHLHFFNTLAINDLGRKSLIDPSNADFEDMLNIGFKGSLKLMTLAYQQLNFSQLAVPTQWESRGFTRDVEKTLTNYKYATWSYEMWDIIYDYISCVVTTAKVYENDEYLKTDTQLQAFLYELSSTAYAALPGVPVVQTKKHLIDLLTTIVYLSSAHHSSVNDIQYDTYAYQPARPLLMHLPVPSINIDDVSDEYVLATLPTHEEVAHIQYLTQYLSQREPSSDLLSLSNMLLQSDQQQQFYQSLQLMDKKLSDDLNSSFISHRLQQLKSFNIAQSVRK